MPCRPPVKVGTYGTLIRHSGNLGVFMRIGELGDVMPGRPNHWLPGLVAGQGFIHFR